MHVHVIPQHDATSSWTQDVHAGHGGAGGGGWPEGAGAGVEGVSDAAMMEIRRAHAAVKACSAVQRREGMHADASIDLQMHAPRVGASAVARGGVAAPCCGAAQGRAQRTAGMGFRQALLCMLW
eukprot:jgi/Ulvmu1/988/UM103_0015.1